MIPWPDMVNGIFEMIGGGTVCLNNWRLWRDREVKGVSWASTAFFSSWGLWNLFYYPSLDQWASFAGGAFLVAANLVWLGQLAYWRTKR